MRCEDCGVELPSTKRYPVCPECVLERMRELKKGQAEDSLCPVCKTRLEGKQFFCSKEHKTLYYNMISREGKPKLVTSKTGTMTGESSPNCHIDHDSVWGLIKPAI